MKVVCVSDTHGLHEDALAIPRGDVFIHAGDFTDTGERHEVVAFNQFLGRLPHRYKLVIAGNHESSFDRHFYPKYWHQYGHQQQYDPNEVRALLTNALYLEDEAVLIENYLFYGTPWQPEFCNWAFNLPRGDPLLRQWRLIPTDTDVLVTHTPPMGHGDLVGCQRVGCADLLHEVENRVRPKLHVFGHVHEGYGRSTSSDGKITYVNASICTHDYEPVNPPFVFDLNGPPKRGWPKHTMPLMTPSSCDSPSIRRNISTNGVSSLSSLSNLDTGMDAVPPVEAQPKDYDLMLHAWLRLCSHKPPFVERQEVKTCKKKSETKLQDFRVDGTASGLLFESTLKLRPVMNVQKRALRYLFSQGFRSNLDNYQGEKVDSQTVVVPMKQEESAMNAEDDSEVSESTKERRNYGISRRVTVAVLKDIDEGKEGMDDRDREHVQQARVAAAALGKATKAQSRRSGRNKTLQRRSAIPKLASLTEEPIEGETTPDCTSSAGISVQEERSSEDAAVSETIVVTSRIVECALCKYNVAGHVHPDLHPTLPPASAKVLQDANEEEKASNKWQCKTENPPPSNRLSSWF
ncbi:unnamed protein product [Peronospora belbahrii]|uniref:Calcineurin-like phosphoesterase domain-containing protein n=1 Tax=Peronospora belbahrii TaxID=622444 RepID=A0ABN8CLH3_9STRA|nr:unnamed protein product [Peronospora belbahrii]